MSDTRPDSASLSRFNRFLEVTLAELGASGLIDCFVFLAEALVVTCEGKVIGVNKAFIALSEYSEQALLKMTAYDLITQAEKQVMQQRFESNETSRYELELLTRSGTVKNVLVSPTSFRVNGQLYRLAEFIDISDRVKAFADLQEISQRYTAVFNQAAVGLGMVAPDGRWLDVNQRLCDIVGYSRSELLTSSFQDITHADDLDEDLHFVSETLAGIRHSYVMEKRCLHKSGRVVWINLTVSLTRDMAGNPKFFVSAIEDITLRKRTESILSFQAKHDALTGLLNRQTLDEVLKRELDRAKRYQRSLSVLMIDIDHFKQVNDTRGHQAGDETLRQLAALLSREIRELDACGRFGGEEFLLVAPELDAAEALVLAQRIVAKVAAHPMIFANQTFYITVSIGTGSLSDEITSVSQLVRLADDAMYQAKAQGRNRAVVGLKPAD